MATKSIDFAGKNILNTMLVIVGIVVSAIAAYFIWGKIVLAFRKLEEIGQNAAIDNSKLSYTNDQYQQFATKIHAAVDGFQTDEEAIYSVFNALQTKEDLMKLIAVYGVRFVSSGWFGMGNDYDLSQSLLNDLDSSELAKINSILAAKGINYSF